MEIPLGYFAVLKRHKPGDIWVSFPVYPCAITCGESWEEAEKFAWEALNGCLESDYERGFVLPPTKKPKAGKGERVVFVPLAPEVRMAYQLRAWREEAKLTQAELAARANLPLPSYQRMERPGRANLTLKTLEKVADALGKRLIVDMVGL